MTLVQWRHFFVDSGLQGVMSAASHMSVRGLDSAASSVAGTMVVSRRNDSVTSRFRQRVTTADVDVLYARHTEVCVLACVFVRLCVRLCQVLLLPSTPSPPLVVVGVVVDAVVLPLPLT
jgi:hypothetical protein